MVMIQKKMGDLVELSCNGCIWAGCCDSVGNCFDGCLVVGEASYDKYYINQYQYDDEDFQKDC